MPHVELWFPVLGQTLSIDHGYALFGAVSRVLGPESHVRNGLGIHAIRGIRAGPGVLQLTDHSTLRIRTPDDRIASLVPLAGKRLELDGHVIRVGVPTVRPLISAPMLAARMVTIKGFREADSFLEAARRKLGELGLPAEVAADIPVRSGGVHAGKPMRRILCIKGKKVVGFSLIVSGLTAEESITIQEIGIGGRRHMGCGLFVPFRERSR